MRHCAKRNKRKCYHRSVASSSRVYVRASSRTAHDTLRGRPTPSGKPQPKGQASSDTGAYASSPRTPSSKWNKYIRVVVKTIASRRSSGRRTYSRLTRRIEADRLSREGQKREWEKRHGEYYLHWWLYKKIRMSKQYDLCTFVLQLWPSMARWRVFERLNARRGLSRRPRRYRRWYQCRRRREGR